VSDEKKDSGFRGRIDRFFDKQAKEQQNLLQGKVGGTSIKDSWEEVKGKVGGKKSKASIPKVHKVKESKTTISKSEAKEVVISPLARSFIRVTTDYPPITIGIMTVITLFMLIGIGKMNINGAMEVYLPKGSVEEELLLEVREDYSTDIIVIYVETDNAYDVSSSANITNRQVLLELDYIERTVDENGQTEKGGAGVVPSDGGVTDNVVWSFSISTLIKELHSTNSRVYDAIISNSDEWAAANSDGASQSAAELLSQAAQIAKDSAVESNTLNHYEIPSQSDIDDIVDDLPPAVVEKVMRDTNGDGIWDTAVILFGITSDVPPPTIIDEVDIAMRTRGEGLNDENGNRPNGETYSNMMLTGPVPVTQAITERSFSEFWRVFPIGVVMCGVAMFLIQKKIRAVMIAGIPTLYSIFITYGIIGWGGLEATPTIIALGPILMALGVAYGLHLSNRFTEEEGETAQIRMMKAMSTTGRAIALSAMTTMIGFGSLMYTNLGPVFTVGLSLTLGILVCLLCTFIMSPAIAVWTNYDHKKVEGEWHNLAKVVTERNKPVLAILATATLLSVGVLPLLQTNIDYLDMVPDDEPTLVGIVKYSTEFNAGAFGMMIARGDFQNDYDEITNDAVDHLDQVDLLVAGSQNRGGLNDVPDVTAISLTEVMKAVKFSTNQSSTLDTALNLIGVEDGVERSFWELLHNEQVADNQLVGRDLQKFLLNVFYDSITPEAISMIMDCSPDNSGQVACKFSKTLIYVDMPLKDIKGMETAVVGVNEVRDDHEYAPVKISALTGVAAIGTSVNAQLISSQITTLVICIVLVFFVLTLTFGRNWKLGLITTFPVMWVISLEPLTFVALGQPLSLVTVMIGSIVIGVGIDFSIHITQRVIEGGINMPSVYNAIAKTAQTLAEATIVTLVGLTAAFAIKISALWWFVFIIVVLLIASMISAMFLLPALYSLIIKSGGTLS